MYRTIPAIVISLLLLACTGDESTIDEVGEPDMTEGDSQGDTEADGVLPDPVAPPQLAIDYDPLRLTELAQAAVDVTPTWLRDDLIITFTMLEIEDQDTLGLLIAGLEDPYLIDEVAFAVAHTSPEVLEADQFHSELFELNARLIYEHDLELGYVEVTDVGDPLEDDDFYSTLTYQMEVEGGGVEEVTIDRELYYWFVVHPRLEDELPLFVDGWVSGHGTTPGNGWFWRDFLWDAASEDCPDSRDCPLLRDFEADVEVFRRTSEESDFEVDGVGQMQAFVGTVLHWGAGDERPIQPNRIYAISCGNCGEYADLRVAAARTALIPARNTGASSNDHTWIEWWLVGTGWQGEMGKYKRGVRRNRLDNDCDGQADDGLDTEDEDDDGVSVAEGDCDDTDPDVFPGATEVLNGRDDDCDGEADTGFVDGQLDGDGDGFSILDGDCDDANAAFSPTGAELPDGVDNDCDGIADNGADDTDADGDGFSMAEGDCNDWDEAINPEATEEVNGRDDDCDGVADDGSDESDGDGDGFSIADGDCHDGDGNLNPDARELPNGRDDNCNGTADDGAELVDGDGDEVTIADGDCNDNDETVFPGAEESPNGRDDTCDGVADEGLSESDRDGDGWTMADGDCNDLVAGINPDAQDPYLSNNRLYAITTARGDSFSIMDRTEAYATLPSYLEFDVTDENDDPVDGAMVTIYGTWAVYGEPDLWAVAGEVVTDIDGHAQLTVGEYNPYGYSVDSMIGSNPGGNQLLRGVERSLPYETYTIATELPGTLPQVSQATVTDLTGGLAPEVGLTVELEVESYRTVGDGKLFGSFLVAQPGGIVDLYVVNEDNYSAYSFEDQFESQTVDLATGGETLDLELPRSDNWIVIISNQRALASTMVGTVRITATPYGEIRWETEVPVLEHRFQLPPGEHVSFRLEQ